MVVIVANYVRLKKSFIGRIVINSLAILGSHYGWSRFMSLHRFFNLSLFLAISFQVASSAFANAHLYAVLRSQSWPSSLPAASLSP